MNDERKPQTAGKKLQKTPDVDAVKHRVETLEAAIKWISQGKTLRDFCRQPGMPCYATIYNWLNQNEEALKRFAHARETGAEIIAEEALEIMDTMPANGANGGFDSAHVAWLRNRAEFRLKLLAKWYPQKYGDKQTMQHEGGVTLNVLTGIPDGQD